MMLPGSFTNTAIITAAVGSVTMFWGHFKSFMERVRSIFVVSVVLEDTAQFALMAYLWKHFKPSRFGDRKFTGRTIFVRPMNRIGKVGFEMTGKNLTFWKGVKPIFIGEMQDKDGHQMGTSHISFIRGMFDIEDLIREAMREYDESYHSTSSAEESRFYVRKVFGRSGKRSHDDDRGEALQTKRSYHDESPDGTPRPDMRPLGYKHEDLRPPVSKTPFQNLTYSQSVKEFEVEVRRWKSSEEWFKERGIPWRFGGGLFGPPGTGKTSFVRAIAQDLGMPVHMYDLTTMSNDELVRFWDESLSCSPCIVLFEDIDRIFDKDKNIKSASDKNPLTMDCLLNCISGVQQSNGILVLVTANDMTKLDPALGIPDETGRSSRPGRLDRCVWFGELTEEGRRAVATRILAGFEHLIEETVKAGENETGAQFESRCTKLALSEYHKAGGTK